MSEDILALFSALDDAYNERNWESYSDFFDENFQGRNSRMSVSESKSEHVENAKRFCQTFSTAKVHHSPYAVSVTDGEWTCTVARVTGDMTGPFNGPAGLSVGPTQRHFDISLATFAKWTRGKIIEEYSFVDQTELLHQTGIIDLLNNSSKGDRP